MTEKLLTDCAETFQRVLEFVNKLPHADTVRCAPILREVTDRMDEIEECKARMEGAQLKAIREMKVITKDSPGHLPPPDVESGRQVLPVGDR